MPRFVGDLRMEGAVFFVQLLLYQYRYARWNGQIGKDGFDGGLGAREERGCGSVTGRVSPGGLGGVAECGANGRGERG